MADKLLEMLATTGTNTGDETATRIKTALGIAGNTLSGNNSGDETAASLGALLSSATAKVTPIDADTFLISDSAAAGVGKKVTFAQLKAAIGTGGTLGGTTASAIRYNMVDKGSVGTGTVTFDASVANVQRLAVTGALTIATSGWPTSGTWGDLLIKLINGGSAVLTLPTINWIMPNGSFNTSFSAYMTALGRTGFQSAGTDLIWLWSDSAGAGVAGKVL